MRRPRPAMLLARRHLPKVSIATGPDDARRLAIRINDRDAADTVHSPDTFDRQQPL